MVKSGIADMTSEFDATAECAENNCHDPSDGIANSSASNEGDKIMPEIGGIVDWSVAGSTEGVGLGVGDGSFDGEGAGVVVGVSFGGSAFACRSAEGGGVGSIVGAGVGAAAAASGFPNMCTTIIDVDPLKLPDSTATPVSV